MTTSRCAPFYAAAALMAALTGCSPGGSGEPTAHGDPEPLAVEVVSVSRGPIRETLKVSGSLIPLRFANIASEVDGVIDDIPDAEEKIRYRVDGQVVSRGVTLDIGHRVKKDQVLVRIDSAEYEFALAAAEASLALAENELAKLRVWRREEEKRQLEAQYDEAHAVWQRSEKDKLRAQALLEKNAISKEQCDRVTTSCSVAKAVKERAEAAWEIAKTGPTKEELAIAEANVALARAEAGIRAEKLAKCTITAPYDAVIVDRYVSEGARVTATPSVDIMQIADTGLLFAQVAVPARYQGRIHVGDPAGLRVRGVTDVASPQTVDGDTAPERTGFVPAVVALVNEKIDPQTRTFRVRVGIENAEGAFRPGAFAEVEMTVDSVPRAVVVPAGAVIFADGEPAVFVLDGGCAERRAVRLGIVGRDQNDPARDRLEVLAGLAVGDKVVVGDATAILSDGMAVRLKQAAAHREVEAGKIAAARESEVKP